MSILEFLKHGKKEKKEPEKIPTEAGDGKNEAAEKSPKDSASLSRHALRILVRPHITEKSSGMKLLNKYVVEVAPEANTIEIKKAIQKLFKVTPLKIHSVRIPGKVRRFGKVSGKTKVRKKAILTLKEGEKIDVGEGK